MTPIGPLEAFPVHHAGRRTIMHPELDREVRAQTAVCYLRFPGQARIDHLELPVSCAGRWVPGVPVHPAHLVVSTLDPGGCRWRPVREIDLPYNPRFAGEGLSQETPIAEMEAFFKKALAEARPYRIELGGVATACLKVECDREHPVWPNHGECNGGPYNVPFATLHPLVAFGASARPADPPAYRCKLKPGALRPSAPPQMTLDTRNPLEIVFRGERLTVGFSTIRPMLTRLAWDHFGGASRSESRLFFRRPDNHLGGLNGPSYILPQGDFIAQNMGGTIEAIGNRVQYTDIDTGCGILLRAAFTVTADAITVEIEQQAACDVPVLEGAAWQLLWDMRRGLTSVAAEPQEKEGRNGFVQLPAMIAADTGGCLAVHQTDGAALFHTESHRGLEARSSSFVLATADTPDVPLMIPKGTSHAVLALTPSCLLPVSTEREHALSDGVRACWSAGFSAFRPEFGGFSNNAISTHCHVNQHAAFDFAAFTARPPVGPDPLALVKFSLGRALLDGGGYGYHRCLYLDSDPILLSGAGRIVQLSGDLDWLRRVGPGVLAAAGRILANFDEREGMVVCRALSGNSGSHRWSSNAMDVVGFGHVDAYVNAWAFRGLKNAAALGALLGDAALAGRCAATAGLLAANYARQLVNPETGWVAGWRSRDGRLHDFGFLWINGVACAFGVLEAAAARRALERLEALRLDIFPESGYAGLPLNLLPIAPADHMLPTLGYRLMPTYENYTDGALSPLFLTYYLRALARHGLLESSGRLVDALERGFADGLFHGPYGSGKEFMTWTGADSGYEGTFGPNSGPLYAIAVARGAIVPPDPEWWLDVAKG